MKLPSPTDEQLIGVADASLLLVSAEPRLGALLGREREPLAGASLHAALPEPSRPLLMLAARRVTDEIVLPTATGAEIVARSAVVGHETWILLFERLVRFSRPPPRPEPHAVGRRAELAELDRYLAEPAATVLYVQGPLGIGKSALLAAYAARCHQLGMPFFWMDGRASEPTVDAIVNVLTRGASQRNPLARLFDAVRAFGQRRWALFVDNFDAWQEQGSSSFERPCTHLPPECRIVVAARRAPDPRWWGSAGRAPRTLPLSVLPTQDAEELARRLGVSPASSRDVAARSAGHPLCVTALASAVRTGAPLGRATPPLDFELAGAGRRDVLEAAAVPARITEEVIAALVDDTDARAVFDDLTTIAVPDASGIGLRLPVVVREALRARLRERNPSRLVELQRRLALHYGALLEGPTTPQHVPVVGDLLDALDDRPLVRRIAGASFDALPRVRRAKDSDREAIADAVRAFAGEAATASVLARIDGGYATTRVAEDDQGIGGLAQYLTLSPSSMGALTELAEDDGELAAALEVVRARTTLAADEYVLACLCWGGVDLAEGERSAPSQAIFRFLLPSIAATPQPAATILVTGDVRAPIATRDLPGAEPPVAVGPYSVTYRDLRGWGARRMFATFLELGAEGRALSSTLLRPETSISAEVVREALLSIGQPEKLVTSPLVALRLVEMEAGPGATHPTRPPRWIVCSGRRSRRWAEASARRSSARPSTRSSSARAASTRRSRPTSRSPTARSGATSREASNGWSTCCGSGSSPRAEQSVSSREHRSTTVDRGAAVRPCG